MKCLNKKEINEYRLEIKRLLCEMEIIDNVKMGWADKERQGLCCQFGISPISASFINAQLIFANSKLFRVIKFENPELNIKTFDVWIRYDSKLGLFILEFIQSQEDKSSSDKCDACGKKLTPQPDGLSSFRVNKNCENYKILISNWRKTE